MSSFCQTGFLIETTATNRTNFKANTSTCIVFCQVYVTMYTATTSTRAVMVVIFVPPDAPLMKRTPPCWSRTMVGDMDDIGIFPGNIKLEGEAGTPKLLTVPGVEKSSISSLKIMPVREPRTKEPSLQGK